MSSSKYFIADSRTLEVAFKRFRLKKIDLIITSPPYFDLLNYDDAKNQIGQKQTYGEYLDDVAEVFQQCYRVSKPDATMWMVIDTIRHSGRIRALPFDITSKLTEKYKTQTWKLKDIIVWNKGKNVPWHSKGRFKNQFEYILFFAKNENYKFHVDKVREISFDKKWWLTYPERYNSNGSAPANIWDFTIPIRGWGNGYQKHLCPFPFALVERILFLSTDKGDCVLDPFAGSGTVLAVAKQMKRHSIGFDVNIIYKRQFENEVIEGARLYWSNRKVELEKQRQLSYSFRKNNLRLRKIKAGISLLEELKSKSKKKVIAVVLARDGDSKEINFIAVTENVKKINALLDIMEKNLDKLQSEFKVHFNLKCVQRNKLSRFLSGTNFLYSYSPNRIYHYDKKVAVKDLTQSVESLNSISILSNIKLQISKQLDK